MNVPAITLVDAPPQPGLRHALLAALAIAVRHAGAKELQAILPEPPASDDVHARQHVTPDGRTEENGVFWLERAGVPIDRGPGSTARLMHNGSNDECQLISYWTDEFAELQDETGGRVASAQIDTFGRLQLSASTNGPTWLQPPPKLHAPKGSGPAVRIAIIGEAHRLRHVYPAVLAALGDAADAVAIEIETEIVDRLDNVNGNKFNGIVLPGGADMGQVEPLAAACRLARRRDMPLLGLCLGMQALALGAVREVAGFEDVVLGEIAPEADAKLFTLITDESGEPVARLGDRSVSLVGSSRIASSLQASGLKTEWMERMNHRFRFEPRYKAALQAGGLDISASDQTAGVVDVIEDKSCKFCVGASGHPELSSHPLKPHPLFVAFVQAAALN